MSELPPPLSEAEIRKEIASLTAGERTKLIKIARGRLWKGRINSEEADDLFQEALVRVLGGSREWLRGLKRLSFLAGVIKSIAADRMRALNRERAALKEKEKIDGDKGAEERDDEIDLERIMVLFDDDPIAQTILKGMADGARGKALQQLSGLSLTEYESKRKKIRRGIEKFIEKLKT